jgi:hypothetical protein
VVAPSVGLAGRGNEAAELTCYVIVFREVELAPRDGRYLATGFIFGGSSGIFFRLSEPNLCDSRFLESGAAEDNNGRLDALLTLDQLGFQEFESDADGAQFFSLEKVRVAIG